MSRELQFVQIDGDRAFIHPLWGAKCPDYLNIIPDKPLQEMSREEKEAYIMRHRNYIRWRSPRGAVHNIRVNRYFGSDQLRNWLNMMSAENAYELWELAGLNDEIDNMRYWFDRRLDVQQVGRSGGWLMLLKDGKPLPVPDDTEGMEGFEIDDMAEFLMWFDVVTNGMIHTAKDAASYLKVERRPMTRYVDVIVDPDGSGDE